MAHKFRRLSTQSDFPNIDNVEVYKYDNDFDYSRYDYTQMELQICTVPWDMGEAHIGARTISGIGNVVYFGSKERRDAWFDAIPDSECFRFSTKFKELHRDLAIDVPIPYDVCAKHNYLKVHYSLFANDNSLVEYEDETGLRDWFWFIREVEFLAPNTTRLHLMDDAFQTWIYDVNVSGMILERGHAPLFATKADTYLANPLENNTYLLTEDVNFGEISQVKHVDVLELNAGDMYACIATTANPQGTWGSKANNDWKTPASASYTNNGQPSVYVFAVPVANLNTLLANINSQVPQFKQTIQGVFFASADLLTLGTSFTFAGTTCYMVSSSRKTFDLVNLTKAQFGYDSKYADLAKLYTSPYAHIEITDETGNVDIVRIEDTDGTLDVSAALSIAYPFITIDAHIMGAGGNVGATVTYKNVSSHTFDVSGRWYDTLRNWEVPTFAVILDAATEYDYSTHFNRAQRVVDYTTAYDNAYASATTARENVATIALANKQNADAAADTAEANAHNISNANKLNADDTAETNRTNAYNSATTSRSNTNTIAAANRNNADASADTLTANATLTTTANTATTTRSNLSAETDRDNTKLFNEGMRIADNAIINLTADSTIAANEQQGAISAASSIASGIVNGAGSLVSGDVAGGIQSIGQGAIGAITTVASMAVANGLTSTQASYTAAGNSAHQTAANTDTDNKVSNQTSTATDLKDIQNNLTTGTTANTAATTKANAVRTQNAENAAASATETTEKANALLSETTAKDNATRTQTVEIGAATSTKNTTKANAARTQNAENAAAVATETTTKANATRNRAQAISNIENDIKQAALREPYLFGQFSNGDGAANKPIALFANIVTQNKGAIASAGDEFLRYGYTLDKFWEFDGNWNIGRYFTYWKLRDFWVTNLNVPDMYMDKLRFFLFGGVTVWRSPEDIGRRTIYENWR